MDKKIKKSLWKKKLKVSIYVGITLSAIWIFSNIMSEANSNVSQQQIELRGLKISTVTLGEFADTLNVLGNVIPKKTIYLDAVSGGRVEEKFVEQGDYVKKGQPLVRLSNPALQLSVYGFEAQITEQLNLFRNTQMLMESNSVNLKIELLDNNRNITQLHRKIKQIKPLVEKGIIAKDKLTEFQEDLDYYQRRQILSEKRKEQEISINSERIKQLEDSVVSQRENLGFAREALSNLLVKAPSDGQLSHFDVEIGQTKNAGFRLGKIDIAGQFKVVVNIGEYYLNKVYLGMSAILLINDLKLNATISKIDSRVSGAKFIVEVDIPMDSVTENIKLKWGQTLEMEILLSNSDQKVLVIDSGAFYQSTGGHWIYALNEGGESAMKRNIVIGKKNKQNFVVLSGLSDGERVITSSYKNFDKSEILLFN